MLCFSFALLGIVPRVASLSGHPRPVRARADDLCTSHASDSNAGLSDESDAEDQATIHNARTIACGEFDTSSLHDDGLQWVRPTAALSAHSETIRTALHEAVIDAAQATTVEVSALDKTASAAAAASASVDTAHQVNVLGVLADAHVTVFGSKLPKPLPTSASSDAKSARAHTIVRTAIASGLSDSYFDASDPWDDDYDDESEEEVEDPTTDALTRAARDTLLRLRPTAPPPTATAATPASSAQALSLTSASQRSASGSGGGLWPLLLSASDAAAVQKAAQESLDDGDPRASSLAVSYEHAVSMALFTGVTSLASQHSSHRRRGVKRRRSLTVAEDLKDEFERGTPCSAA